MRYRVELDGEVHELELSSVGPGRYLARLGSGARRREVEVTVLGDLPTLAVLIEGCVVELLPLGPQEAAARGARSPARLLDPSAARPPRRGADPGAKSSTIRAPMPGRIVKLMVAVGEAVGAGQRALVIEAMKMENELICPRMGTVTKVFVAPGEAVERGAPLIEIG
jgi:biotin carboxyl carrier protein